MAHDRFARGVLLATALAFAGPGTAFLLAPDRFAALVDLSLLSATAASDARAVFGGLELGLAAWLASVALGGRALGAALAVQRCVVGGMLVGRAASFLADGPPGPLAWLLIAIEASLFLAGITARTSSRSLRPP